LTNQEEHNTCMGLLRTGLTKAVLAATLNDDILVVGGLSPVRQMVNHTIDHVGALTLFDCKELTDRLITCLRVQLSESQLSNPILLYRTVEVYTQYSDKNSCMITTITFETLVVTAG